MDTPCLSGRSWGPAHLPRTFPSRLPGWLSSWSTSQGWGWREARPGLGRGRWESEDPTSLAARSYRTRATGRRVPSPLWGVIPPTLSPELLSEKDRNTDSRESPSQRPPPLCPHRDPRVCSVRMCFLSVQQALKQPRDRRRAEATAQWEERESGPEDGSSNTTGVAQWFPAQAPSPPPSSLCC